MQLVRLRRRLADIKAILDAKNNNDDDEPITLTSRDFEKLYTDTCEAIDAAEKIGLGHHAIAEVLNRI